MKRIGAVGIQATSFHGCEPVPVQQQQQGGPNGNWRSCGDQFEGHQPQAVVQKPMAPPGQQPPRPLGSGPKRYASRLPVWGTGRRQTIQTQLRPSKRFTLPDEVVSCARAHGLRAELKTGASIKDVQSMIDQGAQPIVLLDSDGSGTKPRYATVTDYAVDEKRHISSVVLTDNATGLKRRVPVEQMMREWRQPAGSETGSRVLISVVPQGSQEICGRDGVHRPASDVLLPTSRYSINTLGPMMNRSAADITSAMGVHAPDDEG